MQEPRWQHTSAQVAKPKFEHNIETSKLKMLVTCINIDYSQLKCKIMVYWNRGAVAFSIDKNGKWKQVAC